DQRLRGKMKYEFRIRRADGRSKGASITSIDLMMLDPIPNLQGDKCRGALRCGQRDTGHPAPRRSSSSASHAPLKPVWPVRRTRRWRQKSWLIFRITRPSKAPLRSTTISPARSVPCSSLPFLRGDGGHWKIALSSEFAKGMRIGEAKPHPDRDQRRHRDEKE